MRTIVQLVLFIVVAVVQGQTLSWDANVEPTVTGYAVYLGPTTRSYTNSTPTTDTNLSLKFLPPGTYFVAVTAHTSEGLESDYSEELDFDILTAPVLTLSTNSIVWPAVTNATGYMVAWGANKGVYTTNVTVTSTSYLPTDNGYYQVASIARYGLLTRSVELHYRKPVAPGRARVGN